MANGDDKKGKLPEGYQLDQEWESGEGPTAAATTAAGQSTPPGARDTTGTLGKLGAISRTVGDTVRGAVTPSKPQGKTASEEAGEAIKRGWRALITPPPPRLPPQGPARETMSAQPGFWQETGRLAAQGPFQMEPRAPAYENMTPEGRAEHPVLARVGDVTRGAKEYGGMLLNLGGLLAGPEYEEFPTAAPRPAPHVPGSQMPAVPRTTLRDIGNVLEQEMNRAPQPRVEARFDDAAHELFGQSYENLNAQQKQAVARRAVPAPTERATIQPVERRAAPAGPPPAGRTEQRMPWVEQTFGHAAPGAESDIDLELRAPAAPPGTIEPVGTVKPAPWKPPSTAGGRVVRGGKVVPEAGAPPPATFTRETKGGADWAVGPGGTYRVSVTPGMSDAEIEQKLAEQKTIHEGMNIPRRPPPQPGTPERPPPTTEEDPLKREFPDPAVRRFARANGPEVVRATEGDPEALEAIHNLTNVEVRQAAINLGMDVGTKHVGQKIGLGPEQVSRQELIGEMMRRGINPRQLPELARPQTTEFAANELKQGDTFVDDKGEPRRVVEIKDGKIETADGTTRTYEGSIDSQTDLNSPKAQLARGGKFITDFSDDPSDFGAADYLDPHAEENGMWHATTAMDKVRLGGLKSRLETKSAGLGGGWKNAAPGKVSVTYDEGHANMIADRMRLAVAAARDEITPQQVLDSMIQDAGLSDDTPFEIAQALGAPEEIRESEDWEPFEKWFDENYKKGDAYELLQELDDKLPGIFEGAEYLVRVGFTASKEAMAKIDPEQIGIVRVEARRGVKPEHVPEESELRFDPKDLRVKRGE